MHVSQFVKCFPMTIAPENTCEHSRQYISICKYGTNAIDREQNKPKRKHRLRLVFGFKGKQSVHFVT